MSTLKYIRQLIDENLEEAKQPKITEEEGTHAIETYYNLGKIIKLIREENINLFLEILIELHREILTNRTYRKNKKDI